MSEFATKPFDPSNWLEFVRVVEADNSVRGGRGYMWYHSKDRAGTPTEMRAAKERLVNRGVLMLHVCSKAKNALDGAG